MSLILYGSGDTNDTIGEIDQGTLEEWFDNRRSEIEKDAFSEKFEITYVDFRRLLQELKPNNAKIRGVKVVNSPNFNLFVVIQARNRLWQLRDTYNNDIQNIADKLLQLDDNDTITFVFIRKIPAFDPQLYPNIDTRINNLVGRRPLMPLGDDQLFGSNPNYPEGNTGIEQFTADQPGQSPLTYVDKVNINVGSESNWSFWLVVILIIIIIGMIYKNHKS